MLTMAAISLKRKYYYTPVACERSQYMCKEQSCSICYTKSFKFHFPEKARQWSQVNTVSPDKVSKATDHKYYFDCEGCGHQIKISPCEINAGRWCIYCNSRKKLCTDEDCESCFKNSFASFHSTKVEQWSSKNPLSPRQVKLRSDTKHLFDCKVCGHEFAITLRKVTVDNAWCMYCTNKKLCQDPSKCSDCFRKTFAFYVSENVLKSYSKKNKLGAHQIFYGSDKKVIFDCWRCYTTFKTSPNSITNLNSWCSHCASKRNKAIEKLCNVLDDRNVSYSLEVRISLANRSLFWDVSCNFEGIDFFIESDGPHHFSAEGVTLVSRRTLKGDRAIRAFQSQRTRDLLKETYINVNNGLLFRFSYRQTAQIEALVAKMLETVRSGKTGVVYMDDIYW